MHACSAFIFIFTRAKRGTYRTRAEDVERCICNDLVDTYETSYIIACINIPSHINNHN